MMHITFNVGALVLTPIETGHAVCLLSATGGPWRGVSRVDVFSILISANCKL